MKKKVLLVGDSIRIGYQSLVVDALGDSFEVYGSDENAKFTKYTLWNMQNWTAIFGVHHFDCVHWNNGIWDIHRATVDGEIFTPIDEYIETNRRLYLQMKSYSDNLIWATTIPGGKQLDDAAKANALINTDPENPSVYLCAPQKIWNEDVKRYNAAAVNLYSEKGVKIDDHYSAFEGKTDRYISFDGIHPNIDGYKLLSKMTADIIKKSCE